MDEMIDEMGIEDAIDVLSGVLGRRDGENLLDAADEAHLRANIDRIADERDEAGRRSAARLVALRNARVVLAEIQRNPRAPGVPAWCADQVAAIDRTLDRTLGEVGGS